MRIDVVESTSELIMEILCNFSGCSSLPTMAWEPVTLVPHPPEAWYPAVPGEDFQVVRASHMYVWGQDVRSHHCQNT